MKLTIASGECEWKIFNQNDITVTVRETKSSTTVDNSFPLEGLWRFRLIATSCYGIASESHFDKTSLRMYLYDIKLSDLLHCMSRLLHMHVVSPKFSTLSLKISLIKISFLKSNRILKLDLIFENTWEYFGMLAWSAAAHTQSN